MSNTLLLLDCQSLSVYQIFKKALLLVVFQASILPNLKPLPKASLPFKMLGLQLPPKPPVAMPRLQDAKNGHAGLSKKPGNQPTHKAQQITANQQNGSATREASSQTRTGEKRKVADNYNNNDTNQHHVKKAKLTSQPANTAQSQEKSSVNMSQLSSFNTAAVPASFPNTTFDSGLSSGVFVPAKPATLRWDKATKSFLVDVPRLTASDTTEQIVSEDVNSHKSVVTKSKLVHGTKRFQKTAARITTHEYNLREPQPFNKISVRAQKRPAPEDLTNEEAGHVEKRTRIAGDTQEPEVNTHTLTHEIVAKNNKRKNKHRPHSRKKAKSQTALNMRQDDLIPHYNPDIEAFARVKAREAAKPKPPPKTFTDLPMEVRLNIWDKVFEDEAYEFILKKYSTRDDPRHMIPHPPPSYNCLFINTKLSAEVKEAMYKSMRVEIDFGRLRPHAMRKFMTQIGDHALGKECERIFFIKKFGLHKVNMGNFAKAKEIVSTHWTIEGNGKMDEDDYANNRIDPQHILVAPPSQNGKLKGLKERRLWKDQLAASEQYKRHMEGWCHPESADPIRIVRVPDPTNSTLTIAIPIEVEKKSCPFENKCLNLKDTKFVIVVKYKFGCIKGRHSRHKEVFYDFVPKSGEMLQLAPPKSKFHKKIGK